MAVVTINEQEVVVPRIVADKVIRIVDLVAEVLTDGPELVGKYNDFVKKYGEENYWTITQADLAEDAPNRTRSLNMVAAYGHNPAKLPEEGVRIPKPAPTQDAVIELFPSAWGIARDKVLAAVGLLLVDNGDLADADVNGEEAVRALIQEKVRWLRSNADIGELIAVVMFAIETIAEEIGKVGAGKVMARAKDLAAQTPQTAESSEDDPAQPDSEQSS